MLIPILSGLYDNKQGSRSISAFNFLNQPATINQQMKIPHQIVVWDKKIESWLPLVVILLLVLLLRLPSFFEPVWYLDETIYLTIGNALNNGQVLYRDIVDHKTPVIYYLAKVGGQTQFRLLLTFWMLATVTGVYILLKKIGLNKKIVWLATFGFGVVTSLPIVEGLLPNGELFVMGFVVGGLVLLSSSKIWSLAFNNHTRLSNQNEARKFKLFFSGFLLGLAILTKVPALFDVLGVATLVYVGFWRQRTQQSFWTDLKYFLQSISRELIWISLGILTPIVLSIIYFTARGAGPEYLQYGLLYNFRYAGSWVPTTQAVFNTLLSLPAKFAVLMLGVLIITRIRNRLHPLVFWGSLWTMLALVAATLSNRPYPHYFQQIILPLTFLISGYIQVCLDWWEKRSQAPATHRGLLANSLLTGSLLILFMAIWQVLSVWYYPTVAYYLRFFKFASGQMSQTEYWQSFSTLVKDNYTVAQALQDNKINDLYIWGTNPSLYALTKTYPADQFTVLFHVTDLNHESATIMNILQARPKVIAIMNDVDSPPQQLKSFIHSYYSPWLKLEHLTLWRLRQAV